MKNKIFEDKYSLLAGILFVICLPIIYMIVFKGVEEKDLKLYSISAWIMAIMAIVLYLASNKDLKIKNQRRLKMLKLISLCSENSIDVEEINKWQILDISNSEVVDEDIKIIENMPNLREVNLSGCVHITDFSPVIKNKNIVKYTLPDGRNFEVKEPSKD